MQQFDLYKDISSRTNGNIYIGVVGPVRTGKSTFVTKFMETMVIPEIADKNERQRAIDELPQSANGKTIMTTEPKFVPNEAIRVNYRDDLTVGVRLIDCVGYMVKSAMGVYENDQPRLVKTPWSDNPIPFEKAGEIGTSKVISEHSTIGIVVTTDGTIGEISRADYEPAEERVVKELKQIGKPFIVVLNSTNPNGSDAVALAESLQKKYGVKVARLDISKLEKEDIENILSEVLLEFPVKLIEANIPKWMQALGYDNELIIDIIQEIEKYSDKVLVMRDYELLNKMFENSSKIKPPVSIDLNMGSGSVIVDIECVDELFYEVLSNECGIDIDNDFRLLAYIKTMAEATRQYNQFKDALDSVDKFGYGIVSPTMEQMSLEEPSIIKQGGKYGVRLKASAPSLHIMRVDVATEVNPIVGSEQQGEDMVKYLLSEFENNKSGLWETNMFGKSLNSLVKEGLNNKLNNVPSEVLMKMRKTMGRIINEGKGGVLCILL